MEPYELTKEDIMRWGTDYAGYEELEEVARTLYGLYIERRKKERPEKQKQIMAKKRKVKKLQPKNWL